MQKRTGLKNCFVLIALAAVGLLAGCFDTKQDFTINPDGSGKVVHESSFQVMDLSGSNKEPEQQLKSAVRDMIKKTKGVEAWRDVTYHLLDDGRIAFKGTAYFRHLSELDIPNQTMLEFDWVNGDDHTASLSLRTKDKSGPAKNSPAEAKALPADALARKIKKERADYQQMKPMMASAVGTMKHAVVFHLPGKLAKSTVYQKEPSGALGLTFEGGKMLEAMDKLMNDDNWMALNSGIMNPSAAPQIDDEMSLYLFGEKGPVQASVSMLGAPAFDYEAEVASAQEEFSALQQQLGTGSMSLAAPAKSGALKSLKVIGVQLVRATGEDLEGLPINGSSGYTLTLLAELSGSILSVTDECGLATAITDDGTSLLPESEFERRIHFPNLAPDKTRVLFEARMSLPGKGVKSLREVSGHLQYRVAGGTKEIDLGFDKLATDATGKELGAQIESIGAESGTDGPQSLALKLGIKPDELKTLYLVTGKTKTELKGNGYGGFDDSYTYNFESETGFPAGSRLVVEAYSDIQTFNAPFKIEGITLLGELVNSN